MASPIVMPSFGMYTAEGTLASWLHPAGSPVREGDAVLEIETDKATYDVPAPASGVLHHVLPVGAMLKEQMVIGYVLAEGEDASVLPSAAPPSGSQAGHAGEGPTEEPAAGDADDSDWIKASPLARRLATEHGISLARMDGSGPGGRVVEADVLGIVNRAAATPPHAASASSLGRVRERVPFTGLRRATADRLQQSQNNAVSLTLTREVRAAPLVDAHAELARSLGVSLPLDAFFVKFLALALRESPSLNAVVSDDELLLLDEVSIGVAVAVPDGLAVPVIRDADTLSVPEIGGRIRELAERARNGKLTIADIDGGTSTVTNLGSFGVDAFTPVLNPPQSSILGIGRIVSRPVSESGLLQLRPTVWLSLTFDHRVTDGVPAAQLLDFVARQIEDERVLARLIEGR